MLCLCGIASFLWPCCTSKPQAFTQNKGCHCKSFGEEDSFLGCHPDHALVLCCRLALRQRKKKPRINSKILPLIFLRKGRKENMSFWKVLLLLALCPVGREVLDSHNGGEKGGQWAAFLGCARWEGARRHPLRHQLSWKAGEESWEQRSISLCRQGEARPSVRGLIFPTKRSSLFFSLQKNKKEEKRKSKPNLPPLI